MALVAASCCAISRELSVEHSHVLKHGLHVRAQSAHLFGKPDKDVTSCSPIARPFGGSVLLGVARLSPHIGRMATRRDFRVRHGLIFTSISTRGARNGVSVGIQPQKSNLTRAL